MEGQRCLFCGGDATERDHRAHCDGRQGAREARTATTRSTREAMTLLARTRRETITQARLIALELTRIDGTTHTRRVFAEMQARRALPAGVRHHHWLGAVFRVKPFQWSGNWFVYSDAAQNIHERRIKTWTAP